MSLSEPQGQPSAVQDPLLYSPAQAAHALGIGRTKVYELMARGDLPFLSIGTARRIPVLSVQRFVDAGLQRQGFLLGDHLSGQRALIPPRSSRLRGGNDGETQQARQR